MKTEDYTLTTERLQLELLNASHAQELWPYVSNPEISKQMSWEAHQTIEETHVFLKNVAAGFEQGRAISWGIRYEGKIIGVFSVISIVRSHRSLVYNKAELAYWLGPEYQGKGIMTEAGVKVLWFAFEKMGLNKVYVGYHEGNRGSKGLIDRLKFIYSHKEREAFSKNGEWIDVQYYDMLKKDYDKLYNAR